MNLDLARPLRENTNGPQTDFRERRYPTAYARRIDRLMSMPGPLSRCEHQRLCIAQLRKFAKRMIGGATLLRRAAYARAISQPAHQSVKASTRIPIVLSRASLKGAAYANAKTARLSRRPGKLDEFNPDGTSLDQVRAAPFFVHRSAL